MARKDETQIGKKTGVKNSDLPNKALIEKMEKSINLFQDDTNPHNVNPWTKPKG
ncbi:MAG TPA: hypothetical protein PK337_02465 [Bacteroidia bacterium]|nr:hypothetical protein [Bacteroidia bacterium]HNF41634.1 hypothetical protein [Bacteroidia bacterium]HNN11871.1 hypothetical protein [Bacteroidia bacterium]HQP01140.1 hypothetical protein [Bacteroidia bacterium]HRS08881.1 hypothetical protein [Bacteroidia bacterium]